MIKESALPFLTFCAVRCHAEGERRKNFISASGSGPCLRGHRQENHAFFLQQCALYALAAKGKAAAQAAVFKYHAVARDAARLGAAVHREADAPRAARIPGKNATCP